MRNFSPSPSFLHIISTWTDGEPSVVSAGSSVCGGRGWKPGSLRSKPDSPWVPEAGNSPPFLLRRVESSAWSYSNLGGKSVPSDAVGRTWGGWRFSAYTGEGQRVSCLFCKIESWFYDDKTSVDKKFGLWRPISLKSVRHVHIGWTCTWASILFILNFLTEGTNLWCYVFHVCIILFLWLCILQCAH